MAQIDSAGNITNPGYFAKNILPVGSKVKKGEGEGSGNFAAQLLKSLNEYRKKHGARPLTLNPLLGKKAEKWAEHLVTSRALQHSGTPCGENIWCQQGPASVQVTGQEVADSWYNEIKNYDFSSPGFQKNCGHFTQLVWKDSKEIGVGLASDGKGLTVVVAQFDPAGNITNPGYFAKNILPVGSKVKEGEGGSTQGESVETPGAPGTSRVATVPGESSGSFAAQLLKSLNEYRKKHGARPLTLNPLIVEKAEKWAEHLVTSRTLQHSDTPCGENIWCQQGPASVQVTGSEAVDSWYNEIKNYDFSSPGFQKKCGHFTQLVWKESKEIGVGLASDGKGLTVVVAQFDPAGNITNPGYFSKNVLPIGSKVKEGEGGSTQGEGVKTPSAPGTGRVAPVRGETSGSFAAQFLKSLNEYRKKHGARPLTLNPLIGEKAEKWAEHLVTSRTLQHSDTPCGENIWCQQGPASVQVTGPEAVDSWYNEIKNYDFSSPGFQKNCGHFTQLVWKESKEIGVGLASDSKGLTVVVAQFDPAGNITNPGYFSKNVLPVGSKVKEGEGGSTQGEGVKTPSAPGTGRVAPVRGEGSGSFAAQLLKSLNEYRMKHGARPLTLNPLLGKKAEKWAEHLVTSRTLQHSDTPCGENIWCQQGPASLQVTGQEAVDSWYSEIKNYDFSSPGFQKNCGHFTQLVWKDSKEIGVGLASDGKGLTVVVAQFDPAGNITNPDYFAKNVLPIGSKMKKGEGGSTQGEGIKTPSAPGTGRVAPVPEKEKKAFIAELLQEHNRLRALHQSQPLRLNSELSVQAQKWADHLIDIKTLQHSVTEYGENLWYKWSSNAKLPTGTEVSEAWYNEIKKYNFNAPGFHSGTGHFTQMVWKASREVGVGYATDGKGMFMVVAAYNPQGNVTNPGYFKDNVLPPRKK